MSLVTLIRDYVDVANSSEQLDGYTFSSLVYYTFAFLFTGIKQAITYCFTFHWFRDLSYFCFTSPSLANPIGQQPLSAFTNSLLEMNASIPFESATKSSGIEYQPLANLLAFSDSGFSTNMGVVLLGFFNGCFSCMHFSAGNFLTIQRMLVQGIPAGLCSAFGTAVGQFSFLICILFGFRGLLFPWLVLEPFHFMLGAGILLSVASYTAQDRRTPTVQWSDKSSLLIYAFTSFALTWCEQTALFQWIGNLSFGAEPTFLETTPSLTDPVQSTGLAKLGVQLPPEEFIHKAFESIQQLVQNSSYLLAFFLGNIAGVLFIGYAVQRLFEWILRYKRIAIYYGLVKQANLPLATLIFAFGFGSLPYYGFDYLITKGFGFVPHERFFQQTLFSPVNLVSKTLQAKESSQGRLEDQLALLFTLEGERSKSFAVDTTPFDDGQYLKASQKRPQTFEDLNYRGEHLWTNRLSRISNMREQANQTQSSFLGPIFSWMRSFLWGDGTATSLTNAYPSNEKRRSDFLGKKPLERPTIHNSSTTSTTFTTDTNEGGTGDRKATRPEYSEEVMVNSIKQRKKFSSFANPSSKHQEQIDNYVKEFDRQFDKGLSNFYNADPYSLIEVEDQWQEKRIKEKCYTNPIYTFLLNTEIDAFLKRQPNSHWLLPEEEILLLKKRQLLSNYYDTLALTNQVSTSESLDQLLRIPVSAYPKGMHSTVAALYPKSYGNTIYNHQFKGTLKVARRLFSVKKVDSDSKKSMIDDKTVFSTPDKDQTARIIKFDQPLYLKEKNTTQKNIFHEELDRDMEQSPQTSNSRSSRLVILKPDSTQPVPADPLPRTKYRGRSTGHPEEAVLLPTETQEGQLPTDAPSRGNEVESTSIKAMHTESSTHRTATEIKKSRRKGEPNIFLLEQAEPLPLYVSWDNQLRKLILTNRFQNRGLAGYTFSEFPINNKISTFFTTWPIPDPFFNKNPLINKVASEIAEENNSNSIDSLPTYGIQPLPAESEVHSSGDVQHVLRLADPQHGKPEKDMGIRNNLRKGIPNKEEAFPYDTSIDAENKVNDSLVKSELLPTETVKSKKTSLSESRGSIKLLQNSVDSMARSFFHQNSKNRFLFQTESLKEPITSDMVNALLQWQKLIKENKQLSKEDKQAAKEKISYWPENVNHSNWSNELIDNDMDFDEPVENIVKKQILLWEFTPPNHGGFFWPGSKINK